MGEGKDTHIYCDPKNTDLVHEMYEPVMEPIISQINHKAENKARKKTDFLDRKLAYFDQPYTINKYIHF